MRWRNPLWRSLSGTDAGVLQRTFLSLEKHLGWPRFADTPPLGSRYIAAGGPVTTYGTVAQTLNRLTYTPWYVQHPLTIHGFAVVTTTATATATTRVGLYQTDESTWLPFGAPMCDTGAVATTTINAHALTLTSPLRIEPGLYWVGRVAQTALATYRTAQTLQEGMSWSSLANIASVYNELCYFESGVTGALPSVGSVAGVATAPIRVWALCSPDST